MSGRLVILPKKSYCPWKPEHVERVLRDERREAERLERKREIGTKQQESELRLTLLRKKQGGLDPDEATTQPQHINLFQAEEEASLEQAVAGNSNEKKIAGVMPVSLGQTALKTRGDPHRPFYLRDSEQVKEISANESRRRDRLDPMRKFSKRRRGENEHTGEDEVEQEHKKDDDSKRRHRKRQKKKKESKRKSSSKNDLQELRRRRHEREAHESIRASALFGGRTEEEQDDRKRP